MSPVTIDPENAKVMSWLARSLNQPASAVRAVLSQAADAAQSPAEPEGLGAVVVDSNKRKWTSVATNKQRWVTGDYGNGKEGRDWLDLWHPVTVLSEGYTPEAEVPQCAP